MQHKKLHVIFDINVQSGNGEWGVDDVLRELEEKAGLTVLSHRVTEGDENLLLARQPYAMFAGATARRVPFP
jgi:hypothetical protein